MDINTAPWRPGSFTKNFSWGGEGNGLKQLHEIIRLGFDNKIEDVPRSLFRERVASANRPDYIPLNFFLFNRAAGGVDHLIVDELVYQAITSDHSDRFDKLAIFAFNLSLVGVWKGAADYQRRPALWAHHYVSRRIANDLKWQVRAFSADDIENFVSQDKRYAAKTARKLATNLAYLYRIGHLADFATAHVERWWVDALFLTLDRVIEDRRIDSIMTTEEQFRGLLDQFGFSRIAGPRSLEKELAIGHLVRLYSECGGRDRFSEEFVRERSVLRIPDLQWFAANDQRPQGAVHPTNPRILKSIPRACAFLAKYAGFSVIDAEEMANFDPIEFLRRHTATSLERLRKAGIEPTMTAEELMKITRDR